MISKSAPAVLDALSAIGAALSSLEAKAACHIYDDSASVSSSYHGIQN